jgi:3,4-dihydroxy 2-butanone 4-phosphate synthase / GTP cyclohydrolase II
MPIEPVERAITALRRGRTVLVTHRRADPPQAAVVVVGSRTTPGHVSFMAVHARGLVCMAMSQLRAQKLHLAPQAPSSRHPRAEDVLVSVEAREGVTTGISAADRSQTLRVLSDERSSPEDLVSPGHIFPVSVDPRGVFARPEIPEGATDLCRLAGFPPVASYCRMLTEEGEISPIEEVESLADEQHIEIVDIDDLKEFRTRQEILVTREAEEPFATRYGEFSLKVFRSELDTVRHIALVMGELSFGDPLVRVHSQCLTGDVFGSRRCDCGAQLDLALKSIAAEGRGALVYLLQEGRGIGLANKVHAYALQDAGQDTVEANISLGFEADARDFGVAAQILAYLGVGACRLLTNNPQKLEALERFGLDVSARVALEVAPDEHTRGYLRVKKEKMGHMLEKV